MIEDDLERESSYRRETLLQSRPAAARKSKVETFVLALAVVALNSFGNLSLAFGLKRLPDMNANPLHYLRAMFDPFVAAGILMLILWLLMRMALMSWADLSFAVPVTALVYVMGTVLGKVFLNETVTAAQWSGTVFIFAGIVLVGSTAQQSTPVGPPL